MTTADANIGAEALRMLHSMARMDEALTLWSEDGFSWWPDRTPVRFRWRAPGLGDAHPVWRLSAEVEALRGVDPSDSRLRAVMLPMTKVLNQFSMILEGDVLKFRALITLQPEVSPQPESLQPEVSPQPESLQPEVSPQPTQKSIAAAHLLYRAACMVASAERIAPALCDALTNEPRPGRDGLRPAHSDHPTAGVRPAPAMQLHSLLDVATFVGQGPAPDAYRPDLDAAMSALRQAGCGMVAGSSDGDPEAFNVVLETRHATSLLELRLDEPNPNVGHGLLTVLRMRFPEGHLHGDGATLAQALTAAEWIAPVPLHVCGAWTAGVPGSDVAYSAFYPNLLHRPDLGREVALDGLRRVRWAFDHLGYTEPFSHQGPYANVLVGRPTPAGAKA